MFQSQTQIFNNLSDALDAFDALAVAREICDYDLECDPIALRDAPAPFHIYEYDTDMTIHIQCPDREHDCISYGCGNVWSAGGQKGVALLDANKNPWLDRGVTTRAA